MVSRTVFFGIALLTASTVSYGSGLSQQSPGTRLRCEFDGHDKNGRLECRAKVRFCAVAEGASAALPADCRNSIDIECSDGFEYFSDEHVRAELERDELNIHSRKARISVEEYSRSANTDDRFRARLKLDAGKDGRAARLSGRCVVRSTDAPPPVPAGSCQPASSLSVLVSGSNVISYVPKGYWSGGTKGVSAVNVEGSSITNLKIDTPNIVNSCASNSVTGQTVCTANNSDVYLLSGTALNSTLTSAGTGSIGFSGGSCTNCNVAMDAVHNKAVIGLSIDNKPGFQFLNLSGTPSFETALPSPAGMISEDPLIDPVRNLLLSPSYEGKYEIVNITSSTAPAFFEHTTGGGEEFDSAGADCQTGIVLAPAEFSNPSQVFIADVTQATFTPGTGGAAGTWSAPSQVQSLSESSLSAGACGMAVAQGTHTGIVTGEFGGSAITAISLPATSGSGTPAITDWVTCNIPDFSMGFDPHTVTAYQSPNGGNAIALLADGTATKLAVVDLTALLDPTIVPRTVGGHACASGVLPASVVRFVAVP